MITIYAVMVKRKYGGRIYALTWSKDIARDILKRHEKPEILEIKSGDILQIYENFIEYLRKKEVD